MKNSSFSIAIFLVLKKTVIFGELSDDLHFLARFKFGEVFVVC